MKDRHTEMKQIEDCCLFMPIVACFHIRCLRRKMKTKILQFAQYVWRQESDWIKNKNQFGIHLWQPTPPPINWSPEIKHRRAWILLTPLVLDCLVLLMLIGREKKQNMRTEPTSVAYFMLCNLLRVATDINTERICLGTLSCISSGMDL